MAKDKLTPLRTKFDIELQIDNEVFKLVFKPVNIPTKKKLDSLRDQSIEEYECIDSKRAALKELKELKAVNDELLKVENLDNKTEILIENKKYIKDISSLEKEIRDVEKTLEDFNSKSEVFYKTVFEECISGEDKVKLQKTIEDMGISYLSINSHINEAVRVSQEKK